VAAGGLWQVATGTVAAGSNGGMLSGIAAWVFPSPGVLDVASTAGFPTSGTLNVVTTGGNGFIAYTGVAGGNQFTGCTYLSGTGTTVGTGAVVTGATYFAPSGVSANCVCAGPDGNLWVGDQTNHCVWQINTSGVVLAQIVLTSSTPNSICAGPDGNIWVLDNTSGSYAVWVIVLSTPKVYVGPLVVG
jgi:streptogramin lyase